jgi:hypothetical protein
MLSAVILTAYVYLKKVFLKIQNPFPLLLTIIVIAGYNVPLNLYVIFKILHDDQDKIKLHHLILNNRLSTLSVLQTPHTITNTL